MAIKSTKHLDMGGFTSHRKAADKRSVFDSDFIGREGKINPRTVKEVGAALILCSLLSAVFYMNFFHKPGKDGVGEDVKFADAGILEKMMFVTSWERPGKIDYQIVNPMLDTNKMLAYQQKYANEVSNNADEQAAVKDDQSLPSVQLKKIKISVKGVLWKPDGESMALIDREMLRENQKYKGYTVVKVLRNSVILSDAGGNNITINIGEDAEIIAVETDGAKL